MGKLLSFLYRFRAFLIFVIIELFCVWLIVQNNDYQRSAFAASSSSIVGSINETAKNVSGFFRLQSVNESLAAENARLRELLSASVNVPEDSMDTYLFQTDTTDSMMYKYLKAEVVMNGIRNVNNFFTINRGSAAGIEPGMGVINASGVVGKVRAVSENFAQCISLLNTRNPISAKHLPSSRMGTVAWEGSNPKKARLQYITTDIAIAVGDTIVTSSFNAVYPKNIMIGTVLSSSPDANNTYLNIDIALSVDFGSLSYVYAIKNNTKAEQDSLISTNPLLYE